METRSMLYLFGFTLGSLSKRYDSIKMFHNEINENIATVKKRAFLFH